MFTRKILKNKMLKVLRGQKVVSLATIANHKPWVRFVMCHSDGLNLYICTYRDSRKVKQIQKNPNVHIAMSKDINNFQAPYLQIVGKGHVRSDYKIRKRFWRDFMRKYYTGIDDPNYVVIEVKPQLIEYIGTETQDPQIYKI